MSSEEQASSQPSKADNRTDPEGKYCHSLEESNINTIGCSFCGTNEGITRAKCLTGKKDNAVPFTEWPKEVREELWVYPNDKKKKGSIEIPNMREQQLGNLGYGYSEDEVDNIWDFFASSSAMGRKIVAQEGLMNVFCGKSEIAIEKRKKEKLRLACVREAYDTEEKARVYQLIARFLYQAGLSFNLIKLKSFQDMLTAIGDYGPNLQAPSYHDIRVPLLNKELEYTQIHLKDHKEQWRKHGCSIMLDAWTDGGQKCLINFLVNSSAGTMFVKSIDGSKFMKTNEKLFKLLDSFVEEIGEEKVVQVITNGSNYDLAGKMLEDKRPHLYWTPCAAHSIELILEDIGKLPLIKKTIQRGISVVGFIYSHSSTLSLLRHFTNKRELVRHAVTRFATSFLSLERLHQEKTNLRKMFASDEWIKNKLSKEAKGKQATKIVLMPSFWNHVIFTLKVMAPLIRVLRLVYGEGKPAIGYIYKAMDKAKENIMKSFKNNESKYKDVFAIIDNRWHCQLCRPLHVAGHFLNPQFFYDNPQLEFDLEVITGLYDCIQRLVPSQDVQQKILNELSIYKDGAGLFGSDFAKLQRKSIAPNQWWRMYGHSAPNLQQLAIKILSLTCSAFRCERNWSVFEQVYSKRNRLDRKKLHKMVYVKYNQALQERYSVRDEIDPITLNDIDECNEWLIGEMYDNDDGAGNELFSENDNTLNQTTVCKSLGVGEPIRYTRQKTRKRNEPSGSVAAPKTSKKGSGATSTSNRKEKAVEDEESEFEDIYGEWAEEEEGYGSLDYKENDYVDVEEED